MIVIYLLMFIIFFTLNCKENFNSEQEDENYYKFCLGNYSLMNCVTDKKCLKYGFKKLCK